MVKKRQFIENEKKNYFVNVASDFLNKLRK